MSRFYEMSVEISGHDPVKAAEIRAAAEEEWPFDDWWGCPWDETQGTAMHTSGQHQLCGGESEEQFTERLSVAIWRANDGFCEVVVNATYLEELPYEIHSLDQSDYARLIQGRHRSKSRRKSK
jgi:hypothetical protein